MPPRPRLALPPRLPASASAPATAPALRAVPHAAPLRSSLCSRCYSTAPSSVPEPATTSTTATPRDMPAAPPARWLSDIRARLGKCLTFGCSDEQTARATAILRVLATDWRALAAGSEGFLTGAEAGGLRRHAVAWGEMDSFQHVNNVNYVRYAESSRVNWITHFATVDPAHREMWLSLMSPKAVGLIMKSITTDFKFPVTYPDRISAYHRLVSPPSASDTSLQLECAIYAHGGASSSGPGRMAARTREDVVVYDYRAAGRATLPLRAVAVLHGVWGRQQAEQARARAAVWRLLGAVRDLERATWDREGAVEDLGAAAGGVQK